MHKAIHFLLQQIRRWRLSLFEKVILANTVMLLGEAQVGFWVTTHHLEPHHYLLDTGFIVTATLLTVFINFFLLRLSFRPLFSLLTTIRRVSKGETQARANLSREPDTEIGELANSFNTMLDRLEQTRHEQTRLILQTQENERRRIALELHDEAGQNLTALLVHTELLHQQVRLLTAHDIRQETQQQFETGLQQLSQLTQQTLEGVRVLAQQLRPSVLDDLGLQAAFRWLIEDSMQRLHLKVELVMTGFSGEAHPLSPLYETTLFRIAQESLTNIVRHAQTNQAWIELHQTEQRLILRIRDNGCGIISRQQSAGSGIIGMRERASLLHGTLTIKAHEEQGTIVEAILPREEKRSHDK
ncbi:ATP-binding protein [Ktedonospora formicarum]|uniref:histidine kinase n=1 Tax=Ktedonospora formicarum TaxID=2778364 RepID=A0A8J3HTF0_9CHLR|nr:ATP-binding protein [Ktedonospora formicarum]GHO42936.1 sensor histidine kinase [Ktedonospora formicarum]